MLAPVKTRTGFDAVFRNRGVPVSTTADTNASTGGEQVDRPSSDRVQKFRYVSATLSLPRHQQEQEQWNSRSRDSQIPADGHESALAGIVGHALDVSNQAVLTGAIGSGPHVTGNCARWQGRGSRDPRSSSSVHRERGQSALAKWYAEN